jgi:hypothetical protein
MRNYAGSALMLLVTIAAAVGSYTINLKVSGERAAVERLRRSIVADARDMRDLQAELRIRARLPEMQRWNDNVLQMSAPAAGQFLRSPVQLASYGAAPPPVVAAVEPGIRYAVTAPAQTAPPSATVVTAAYARPAATPSAPAGQPRIIRASYPTTGYPAASYAAPSPRAAAPPPRAAPRLDTATLAADIGASLDVPAPPRDLIPEDGQ